MPETATVFKYDNERPIPGVSRSFDATQANEPYMAKLKVQVNEDGTVVPDESDLVNLDELIQTYKDQCGMDMAVRMMKLGQIDPASLADDGKHSADLSVVPDTAQGIANAAIAAKGNVASIKAQLGLDPSQEIPDDVMDSIIRDYISKNLDKFVQPTVEVKPTEGGTK